jgi:50S ribosomal protein L16 3-hydroxylase
VLSRKTQMLYRGKHVFINGESFASARQARWNCWPTIAALKARNWLDDVLALYTWYQDGWIELG